MLYEALEKALALLIDCFRVQLSSLSREHMFMRVRWPKNRHTELAEALEHRRRRGGRSRHAQGRSS